MGIETEHIGLASFQKANDALRFGEVDFVVYPMDKTPVPIPDGLTIAGTSQRWHPSDCILLNKSNMADNQLFKLKNEARIGVSTQNQMAQILDYRPDLQCVTIDDKVSTGIELLQNGELDAAILPKAELVHVRSLSDDFETIHLNVREFVPAPGQGAMAYICCKDDLETRRLIQQNLHQTDVSAVTNVERKVLKLLGGDPQLPLGVYCEQDANGYYHVWAALADAGTFPVRRVRLSQSTHLGLAERVVAGLDT
ncbi:MAG: hydroxymethylbilane synthase [Saprospiraceae bacterium]|nr:hydroxymethylbilane synthase [Saprospiraceae bacterium]